MIYLFDTNAVLHYLENKLSPDVDLDVPVAISEISEIELYGYHALDSEEETSIRSFLAGGIIIPFDPRVKVEAIRLRRRYRLKTPDAIVAATAVLLGAVLVTSDRTLLRLPEIPTLRSLGEPPPAAGLTPPPLPPPTS